MPTVEEQSQQQMTNAWMAKVDAMWEAMQVDVKREQEYTDGWKALALRQAEANQQIVNRLAQGAATISERIQSDGASESARANAAASAWQNLVLAGALTNPAELSETAIGAKVATEVRSVAKEAIDAAVAAVPGTSAPSQGTTGVAQGAIQTADAVATGAMVTQLAAMNNAMMAQMAKLAEAMNVLTLKVAALEVAPKPAG